MKHFKFYDFLNVEVCALKCIDDEEMPAIRFIAVSELGTIEMTPGFDDEATRDEAWEKNCEGIANSLSVMVEEAFEEYEDES